MVASTKVAIAGGALLLLLLFRKAPAAAKVPEPKVAPPVKPKGGAAELSNGNMARFLGDVFDEANQVYVRCESKSGAVLDDSACRLVLSEFPEIQVGVTAKIRMSEGRVLV